MIELSFGSVCSGIEAASIAWHPLGWRPAFFSEIDPFACAALAHHYPHVPNFGDMNGFKSWPIREPAINVLVGGTPCQSFSVAGLRKGMADPRGNLSLTYLGVVDRYRPDGLVWENVPGVLSIDGGRAFAAFLGGLAKLGYGWAYRILDAQYFGVPQRRRRVFVVASARGWARAAAVLFERESLRGDPAPSREARQAAAAKAVCSSDGGIDREDRHEPILSSPGDSEVSFSLSGRDAKGPCSNLGQVTLLAFDSTQITHPENRSRPDDLSPQLAARAHAPAIAFTCKDHGADAGDLAPTLRGMSEVDGNANAGGQVAVAYNIYPRGGQGSELEASETEVAAARNATDARSTERGTRLVGSAGVRRLTPRECERLQGFPDDYTLIPYRGKPAKDGPRYRALGNSMAVPVMRWIGERIALIEALARADEQERVA